MFSGAGGGLLGTKLLGWETVGYVEIEDYCQRVIRKRIEDGILDRAPIFGNIGTFVSEGFARSYTGLVDIITAGFPCQPFSIAGRKKGSNDERNKWPETRECIRIIRPEFALLENVPGILSSGYFGTILKEISEIGYNAKWRMLSAAELGAPHKRDRIWILCTNTDCKLKLVEDESEHKRTKKLNGSCEREMESFNPNTRQILRKAGSNEKIRPYIKDTIGTVDKFLRETFSNTTSKRLEREESTCIKREQDRLSTECGWWTVEPILGRVAHGVADRVDRLKAIGN